MSTYKFEVTLKRTIRVVAKDVDDALDLASEVVNQVFDKCGEGSFTDYNLIDIKDENAHPNLD